MKVTLANLADATAQQVFNQVASHLLTQKVQSLGYPQGNEACAYRGENNTACAAGCLISDEEMKEVWEKDLNTMGWRHLTSSLGVTDRHLGLIIDLQNIHDDAEGSILSKLHVPQKWEDKLRSYAARNSLEFNWVTVTKPVTV